MAPAPYIMYGKWALEVLDHEVPKIGESINQLIKNWKFGPMKLKNWSIYKAAFHPSCTFSVNWYIFGLARLQPTF